MRGIHGVVRRGKAQQTHGGFSLGLQLRQDLRALHGDRAGLRVQTTTGAQRRRRATVHYTHHDGLAMADRGQLGGQLGFRAQLLRAVGAANQGQTGHSDQTEQQALQHALLSRIRHKQAGSIAVRHCG
ncbi:hypothetical protein D3C75_456000 [compost metagenome]